MIKNHSRKFKDFHLCRKYTLNGVNPFDYLTQLLKHTNELAAHPADWMPWNYQDTFQQDAVPGAG